MYAASFSSELLHLDYAERPFHLRLAGPRSSMDREAALAETSRGLASLRRCRIGHVAPVRHLVCWMALHVTRRGEYAAYATRAIVSSRGAIYAPHWRCRQTRAQPNPSGLASLQGYHGWNHRAISSAPGDNTASVA
jgi:hypothetical protein